MAIYSKVQINSYREVTQVDFGVTTADDPTDQPTPTAPPTPTQPPNPTQPPAPNPSDPPAPNQPPAPNPSAAPAEDDDDIAALAPMLQTSITLPNGVAGNEYQLVVVNGQGQPGALITLKDDSRTLCQSILVEPNGSWECAVGLPAGQYTLTAIAFDQATGRQMSSNVVQLSVTRTS
jgi:hypothetical protein